MTDGAGVWLDASMVRAIAPILIAGWLALPSAGCSTAQSQSADGATSDAGPADNASTTDGAGEAGSTCLHEPDLTRAAPVCNAAVNSAQAVPFTARTGAPPPPSGGTIVDGVYVSTAAEGFGAITPAGRRITLVVLAGATKMLWKGEILDATGATVSLSFTANTSIATSGNQITFTVDCASASPSPIPPALTYTAAPGLLLFSLTSGADTAVTTYTRTGCP
ncbi:MAG TPA: hypothetical protein VH374_01550 [Polyangia bacterium]|nr:hypothetical protein [Polyangia bacterium]